MDNSRYDQQDDALRLRIAQLCDENHISFQRLSKALGHSSSYISNIMTGDTLPSIHGIYDICDHFSMPPSQFFRYTESSIDDTAYLDKVLNTTEQQRKMISDFIDMLNKNHYK